MRIEMNSLGQEIIGHCKECAQALIEGDQENTECAYCLDWRGCGDYCYSEHLDDKHPRCKCVACGWRGRIRKESDPCKICGADWTNIELREKG